MDGSIPAGGMIPDPQKAISLGEETLMHYGVKGMKWGVTRADPPSGMSPRKVAKADAKFEKLAGTAKVSMHVYNNAAAHLNEHDIPRINNDPKYKDKDFTNPSKLRDQYYKDYEKAFENALRTSAKEIGTNMSGTRRFGVKINSQDGTWEVITERVRHADDKPFRVIPKYDQNGYVISVTIKSTNALAHYGVKGMKWGVRNSDSGSGSSPAPRPRMSEDAKVANKVFGKIERGGTGAASNKEMQDLITRMNLEKQFHNLQPNHKNEIDIGLDAAKKVLAVGKTIEDARRFLKTPTGKAIKSGIGFVFATGTAWATGGTSAAAGAAGSLVVRRMSNHYSNVGN